ncbi:centrosomal protein of 57 kDa [Erpetoichthys calabaricus]|uniref:Centrosomal protein 57 n=1 Tax=Erpetoichthys calabaricus TaxID=27687 RepID=A0A8C4RJM9_ERPCA|nr:centrosomal protein of 57 kDa [Erpetoichthys calabaricus]
MATAVASYSKGTPRDNLLRNTVGPEGIDCLSEHSCIDYPTSRPFLNSDLHIEPGRPVNAYPLGNRTAIFTALKNLQEKIHHLEQERMQAQENLQRLSRETLEYKKIHDHEREHRDDKKSQIAKQNEELSLQLKEAESRCSLLEKQLEYMRKMVHNAEADRTSLLMRQMSLEREKSANHSDVQSKLEKLDILEREYCKLTATQRLAESKIRDLEQKLYNEEHHRKLLQHKAVQLQTGLEANRILLQSISPPPPKSKKTKKKKNTIQKSPHLLNSHTQQHYRFSLRDVPFVAGKSTSASHSVRANVQNVLHLMKHHSRVLCNERVLSDRPLTRRPTFPSGMRDSDTSSSSSSCEELSGLLLELQDEFGHMSLEHHDLAKQIQAASSEQMRQDLERDLQSLVKRMESKGDQIAKVHRHQQQLTKLKAASRKQTKLAQDSMETKVAKCSKSSSRERGRATRAKSCTRGNESLRLLRDMQTLQNSLRKDDVCWDY